MSLMEFTFLVQTEKQRLITELDNLSALRSPNPEYLDHEGDQDSLIRIGKALNIERDPDKLLRTILYLSKKITGADAGSIFLVDGDEEEKKLRFKYSHTFSKELEYEEFCIPMDTSSIAGYVSVTGKTLNFPDVYELDGEGLFHFNSSFDETHGYRTKSMLVTPMVNHIGQIIGVIQLINSKENFHKLGHYSGNEAYEIILDSPGDFDRFVVPFKIRYEDLMEAVASQAAIALENSQMLRQIETQFEAFVKASVSAIESRDPATSGHSFRVAQMSIAIAKEINHLKSGPLKDAHFSQEKVKELEFACLLHDFGKVYVDLDVIMKAKKFFPRDLEYLHLRLDFLQRSIELDILESQIAAKDGNNEALFHQLQEDREKKASCIQEIKKSIQELNEPSIWVENRDQLIDELIHKASILQAKDCQGKSIPFLTEEELENLRITRGSLSRFTIDLVWFGVEGAGGAGVTRLSPH